MSIKDVKPTNNSGYNQGYYNPLYPKKYAGKPPIIYRSSWELKFMKMCDNREDIVKWASEPVEIKYWSSIDKKEHKYFPDFYIKVKKKDGYEESLIEIKPSSHLKKPAPPTKNSKQALKNYKFLAEQFVKNRDKYRYAKEWAQSRGFRFVVMTEKSLK
tara:strand:+ start:863 stop:1336 length:474 start_codon:yes stop_codon:yes gene_type:complete